MQDKGLILGSDNKLRCWWCGSDPEYMRYHDEEWGKPVYDDYLLFEKISLEGFQAGLSWLTILRKRDNFRKAFDNFDFDKIAIYDRRKIDDLMGDAGIIRHKGKIEAVINNARCAQDMMGKYGSLNKFFWSFKPDAQKRPKIIDYDAVKKMSISDESLQMSKSLKKLGWKFVGPTTCYAFMQSMGIVNDHVKGCHVISHL